MDIIFRSIKFQDHIVLLDAIIRKDYDETEILLESGVTPNSANEDGLTAIHQVRVILFIVLESKQYFIHYYIHNIF